MPDAALLDLPAAAPPADAAFAAGEADVLAPTYAFPRLELVSGRGARVTDRAGREYLDFVSGIAVNALGHAAPAVARAVAKQVRTLAHVSNLYANAPAVALATRLTSLTGYARVFFCNSGTEGVEAALKFARARARANGTPGRDVLAFRGGFHGRSAFALSATWTPAYREPFEPLVPGVRFGDFNDVAGLDALLDAGVAAVIVEPVQGESGAVPATRAFLQALRARTMALGATLVFDEVQTGMGRCGRFLAQEHYGVRADVTVLSKALGGGLPLGAVLVDEGVASALAPGMHGSTFGGGPVATAAGLAVVERVSKPAFLGRVRARAKALHGGLARLAAAHPSIAETRGLGLLAAVDLRADAGFGAADLVRACRDRGVLVPRGGERAVRLLPPLVATPADVALAMERLDAALTDLERSTHPKELS